MEESLSNPKYYLETMHKLIKRHRNCSGNNHYEFILENGIFWKSTYSELMNSPQECFYTRHCYYNAYNLAKASDGEITYVEGFAGIIDKLHN